MIYPQSVEAKLQKNRKFTERLADDVTRLCGSFSFFLLNIILIVSWILINIGGVQGIIIFDPYPFILLTMILSVEAIVLSVFVLISQNRQSTIASLREEIHLQINEIAEKEVTKCLRLLVDLHKAKFPSAASDPELERMLKATDAGKIEARIEKELEPQPLVIAEFLEKLEEKIPFYRRKK